MVVLTEFVPGGNIPRVETKKRECWKFLDWRLNSENDSRVHGQPSFAKQKMKGTNLGEPMKCWRNEEIF